MKEAASEYLIDVSGQDREKKTVRQLCATPFLLDDLLTALGIPAGFHWVILEMPHGRLIDGRAGDVDLLAGPLTWADPAAIMPFVARNCAAHPDAPEHLHWHCAALELATNGGLLWPPRLDYLVAVEAKCAYFDSETQRVMSQKASESNIRNLRLQINELVEITPFNRVALLDLIVNPPASGVGSHAWFAAADTAMTSFQKSLPALQKRLPPDSVAGHYAMSWGAIAGGTEGFRGTGAPLELRRPVDNPRLREEIILRRREQMENGLRQFFAEVPRPLCFPLVLDAPRAGIPPAAEHLSRAPPQASQ